MIYLVFFSLSILVASLWHSIRLSLLVAWVGLVATWIITRNTLVAFASLGSIILWVLAVLVYDLRTPVHHESNMSTHYSVQARETPTRYRLIWDNDLLYFLYSRDDSLQAGNIVTLSNNITPTDTTDIRWKRAFPSINRQIWQQVDRQDLEREFDYDSRLYMRWIAWSLFDDQPRYQSTTTLPRYTQFKHKRIDHLSTALDTLSSHALALAMLFGDRSQLSEDIYQDFIDSGLVHLIAVSGTHIAIMLAIGGLLLMWLPFYPRLILLSSIMIIYALMVGFRASIIRASIMSGLTLLVLLPGRKLSIYRLLAYARVIILAYNPYMLAYDLGFALSFSALCGIIWTDRMLHKPLNIIRNSRYRLMRWWWQFLRIVLASLGATIGILPVLSLFTWEINLLAPLLNAFVIIRVPLTMALVVLTSFVSWPLVGSVVDRLLQQYISIAAWWANHGIFLQLWTLWAALLLIITVSYFIRWVNTRTNPRVGSNK